MLHADICYSQHCTCTGTIDIQYLNIIIYMVTLYVYPGY